MRRLRGHNGMIKALGAELVMIKILVVEDAHSLRTDIVEMLEYEGYAVASAENGKVALDLAQTFRPDVIVSDIMMPVMDGLKLLAALRADGATATIPLIFLTARTDRVDMRQGMELGADDFVTKPFHAVELLATVQTQVKKKQQRDQEAEARMDGLRDSIILALPHELRTPLNAILGFSELMMLDADALGTAKVLEMSAHIHTAGKRLLALIENYLLYANIELLLADPHRQQNTRSASTEKPVAALVESATRKAEKFNRADGLAIDLQPVTRLAVSETYLCKLVDELVDNAFKFSPKGSIVHLQGRMSEAGYIVRVIDQGNGITPEQVAQIGAYMQFDRRIHEQQGSGLGLVIAQRLCDLIGAGLSIESSVGQGTTISVALPVAQPAVSA